MKLEKIVVYSAFIVLLLAFGITSFAQTPRFPRFKVLAFFNKRVEQAHVEFANDAIKFFKELTIGNGFVFDTTSSMADLNDAKLKDYQLVMMLNDFPHNKAQQESFQRYMENGGGWYGFHVAAYNDNGTNWPWLLDFLGGGVFYRNNWPPMPAKLVVDDPNHPVNKGLPATFISPINEWYQWKPSPRERKNIKVLVTLSPDNYPFGLKDIVPDGDFPVVWTNTNYRMIYMNMGHGTRIFSDATQCKLIIDALRWVIEIDKKGNVFLR
ncbi:MAG: ThuA domain-containing protein [Bacteroidota bacterium]|nr:ThuA domain-containing protein [Bacteroidota bacterium]